MLPLTEELEGEAYFEVSKDEDHPFIVRTERLDVTVLGTGFNVMAYKQDPRTEVTLVKGKVDVRRGEINEILTPSRQFVMNNENQEYEVKTVNVATYVDWKDGVLNFDGMPLEELGDKLGRWYEVKFFFTKESLKRLPMSGNGFQVFVRLNPLCEIRDLERGSITLAKFHYLARDKCFLNHLGC